MAPALVEAHLEGERRLRRAVAAAVAGVWAGLPGYDDRNVDEWLSSVLPIVAAGQQRSAAMTDAYLARVLRRNPLGLNPARLAGAAVRNGTDPEEVYRRPLVTVWTALKRGTDWDQAVASGLDRATSTAEMDIQLAMRGAADAVGKADPDVFGFRRVANAEACKFCRLVNGAYVKSGSAMALHNRCGCGLEPLTRPHELAAKLPSGVAVHEHGELGPVLADPSHEFVQL